MKTITLTQPFATLVALGAKRIETRSWRTDYRGPLAIHAAAGLGPVGGKVGLGAQCSIEPFWSVLQAAGFVSSKQLPRGQVVATCTLIGIEEMLPGDEELGEIWRLTGKGRLRWDLTDQERAFGDFSPGRYAWLLADVQRLATPIAAKGALGLWEWTPREETP